MRAWFTLIQLLVVAIIGPVAAFVAPRYFVQVGKSSARFAKALIPSPEHALEQSLGGSKSEGRGQ